MRVSLLVVRAKEKLEWSPISGISGICSKGAREINILSKTLLESGVSPS